MADPYEVDDQAATEAMRRQIEATLRFMTLSTVVGVVVIAVLAVVLKDIRGVLILVGIVYLLTSAGAYWYLRRNFMARLARGVPSAGANPPADSAP